MMREPERYMKTRCEHPISLLHVDNNKSSGNGVLIIGGLIIGGIIIAMILKTAKARAVTPESYYPPPMAMQERISQLEQQLKAVSTAVLAERGGPSSQGFGFQLPEHQLPGQQTPLPLPLSPQNLIFNNDGSVTDADIIQGEKYKNKESWSIKRDEDGAITGIDVERNASVGNNGT